jgi:aspartyl-tRNA(Asn)/glutamyl-tRNA(Gln) amidotransferase subunit C
MSLSDDQVRRLARLARIAVRAEETAAVIDRLNRVLGLVDQMRAVDTTGIEPMAHPLDAHLPQGQRLVAPAVQDGLYLVPKVIE